MHNHFRILSNFHLLNCPLQWSQNLHRKQVLNNYPQAYQTLHLQTCWNRVLRPILQYLSVIGKKKKSVEFKERESWWMLYRYYNNNSVSDFDCTPEIIDYNSHFVKTIEKVKRRHDPVVTTVGRAEKKWYNDILFINSILISSGYFGIQGTFKFISDWYRRTAIPG
jgi:hypothetical protein